MRRNVPALLATALAEAALAAGCAGAGASAEPVTTTEVEMVKSCRFDANTIEVAAGETVTWTNEDNFTHTVQVEGQERPQGRARRARLDHIRRTRHPSTFSPSD